MNTMQLRLGLAAVCLFVASAVEAAPPILPQLTIETAIASTPVTGRSVSVPAGGDLQAAIDNALPGDEILLAIGATYPGPFVLRNKLTGSGWITIRTGTMLPPVGTRVTPATAIGYARIVAPGFGAYPIQTEAGAHHYRLIGIEFAKASPSVFAYGLVNLGNNETQNTAVSVPHHIILDRIYVHGDPTSDLKFGVSANANYVALIDSYIADVHAVGQDAQAFVAVNATGPFKLLNTYFEGAGENVLFGGDDPRLPNAILSDIEFRGNHVRKPLAWFDATGAYLTKPHWAVKNLFELKNAQRVLVTGNVFEGNWVDGQAGYAILLTPRNQYGTCLWCSVLHVTITYNVVRHVSSAFNLLGTDNERSTPTTTTTVLIQHNLVTDVSASAYGIPSNRGDGRFLMIAGVIDTTVDHNTVLNDGLSTVYMYQAGTPTGLLPAAIPGFVFTNNLVPDNWYGIIGAGQGPRLPSIAVFFPTGVFAKNAFIGGPADEYPAGNVFPASMAAVGFIDPLGDYRLAVLSPYRNAGTDGQDLGADIAGVLQATAGVESGFTTPAPTPVPTPPPAPVPPPVPTGLRVTALAASYRSKTTSALTWTAVDADATVTALEVWRTPVSTYCSELVKTRCQWSLRKTVIPASGLSTWTGATSDTITRGVTYWYGVHVFDSAGRLVYEPTPVKYVAVR